MKFLRILALPETDSKFAPENKPFSEGNGIFQPSLFRGELAVTFREGAAISLSFPHLVFYHVRMINKKKGDVKHPLPTHDVEGKDIPKV